MCYYTKPPTPDFKEKAIIEMTLFLEFSFAISGKGTSLIAELNENNNKAEPKIYVYLTNPSYQVTQYHILLIINALPT